MDKRHVVKFLKQKKRGIYNVIVEMYTEVISTTGPTMALEIIKEDLEKETGEQVALNYFSLAQAIAKTKPANAGLVKIQKRKWEFKDSNELKPDQGTPGKFKLD
jgi:hypothetical protein